MEFAKSQARQGKRPKRAGGSYTKKLTQTANGSTVWVNSINKFIPF